MARKKKHEEHENHERWLISYADFITLLFAFFVVMYSVSAINEGKFRVLSDSMIAAFKAPDKSIVPIQVGEISKSTEQTGLVKGIENSPDKPMTFEMKGIAELPGMGNVQDKVKDMNEMNQSASSIKKMVDSSHSDAAQPVSANIAAIEVLNRMADKIAEAMSDLIKRDLISMRRNGLWLEVEIKTSILFPSGSAMLQADAIPVLGDIANILKDFKNPIRVEGFTDSVPITTMEFPSNWELSAGRAASVVHLFSDKGIDPRRMAAVGMGEYRPIADNSTFEGRNKNRRVVLVILENTDADKLFGFSEKQLSNGSADAPGKTAKPVKQVEPAATQ